MIQEHTKIHFRTITGVLIPKSENRIFLNKLASEDPFKGLAQILYMGFAKSVIRWIYLLDSETVPKLFFHQINPRNEEISASTFQKYILLLCCDQYERSYDHLDWVGIIIFGNKKT